MQTNLSWHTCIISDMYYMRRRRNKPIVLYESLVFPQVDPTANLTFNLHLSDTEREAKEKLLLPFDFREEK